MECRKFRTNNILYSYNKLVFQRTEKAMTNIMCEKFHASLFIYIQRLDNLFLISFIQFLFLIALDIGFGIEEL